MAKQRGLHSIEGTVGGATYSKTKDGYSIRSRAVIPAGKFKGDQYERFRENAAEFSRAGKAGKVLRNAIPELLKLGKDSRVTARLLKQMTKIVKSDPIHARGQRTVENGDVELLKGFEFNEAAPLSVVFKARYTPSIEKTTGKLSLHIPSFIPGNLVKVPEGSSHFQIVTAGLEIDFANESCITQQNNSPVLPWDKTPAAEIMITNEVTVNSVHPLFLVAGIQFFQRVNGVDYPLKSAECNALSMVMVSGS
jgi:hypothetical protein